MGLFYTTRSPSGASQGCLGSYKLEVKKVRTQTLKFSGEEAFLMAQLWFESGLIVPTKNMFAGDVAKVLDGLAKRFVINWSQGN